MSRPRVDFVSPPFRGHLHPILGMARALREIADVRVLSTDALLPEIAASGVEGVSLVRGRDAEIDAIANPTRAVRNNPLRLMRQFRATLRVLGDLARAMETEIAARRPDLVIADFVLSTAGCAAQRAGVPWWTSHVSPCAIEPRRGAPGYLGGWRHREDLIGRVRDRAGLALVRAFKRVVFQMNRSRIRAAGVSRLYQENGDEAAYSPECILGLGMTELEFPREWPRAFTMIGPVLYTPPSAAKGFALEPGRKHVLVSFGTHLGWMKDAAAARVRKAAEARRAWVAHFTDGRPDLAAGDERDSEFFRRHRFVSYDSWLGSFDLVVHHGGTGVMYHCIKEAKPALVSPVDYDHFDHAARIERAGIGRRVHEHDDLGAAIDHALADAAMRAACARMQECFRRYRAEETIREMVETRLGRGRAGS